MSNGLLVDLRKIARTLTVRVVTLKSWFDPRVVLRNNSESDNNNGSDTLTPRNFFVSLSDRFRRDCLWTPMTIYLSMEAVQRWDSGGGATSFQYITATGKIHHVNFFFISPDFPKKMIFFSRASTSKSQSGAPWTLPGFPSITR